MGAAKIKVKAGLTVEGLIEKLINTPGSRIILDIAEDATIFDNEINLRLLKFYAEEKDKELIIKSNNPELNGLAHQFGISTLKEDRVALTERRSEPEISYRQEVESEIAASPEPEPEMPVTDWPQWQGGLPVAIIITMFSLFLACWWFLQPQAVVIVYPKEQTVSFTTLAQIGIGYNAQQIPEGKIPARILEKENRIRAQTVTTGSKIVGVTPAVGRITLINSTTQPILLPKGSVVSGKAGVRFLTDEDVLVPKRYTKYQNGIAVGEEYGRAEVSITSEKKGTIGNQPSRSITTLSGRYQRFLKVVNPAPTKNGTDRKVPVVTLDDVKRGENEAKLQLRLVGPEEAAALAGNEYLFLPELVRSEIVRVVNAPDIGAEGETLQTTLDYRISLLAPLRDDLYKYLVRKFEESILQGFKAAAKPVALKAVKAGGVGPGGAELELTGQGSILGIIEPVKLKNLIKGKTPTEASDLLTRQNEVSRFKIELKNKSERLPRYTYQIKVILPAGGKP
ncbi:MAG: hypothetical protein GX075_05100 [Firmicutes bacterium]|nr:hypothetical protein [Bacillota bacterium]